MKFLTDENIAVSVVHSLRKAGFDVKDVKEEKLHGTPDDTLLSLAHREGRIILTHDKDFGNLINQQQPHKGVVLLRFRNQKPDNVAAMLNKALSSSHKGDIFSNNFVIVSETTITVHWKEKERKNRVAMQADE